MSSVVKVMVVEDHEVMRAAIVATIERMSGFDVELSAGSAEDALDSLATSAVELAVVDLSLPGMNGDDLVRCIAERHPDTICILLSGHQEASHVTSALAAGALGYVVKGYPEELEPALRAVAAGERYLSPAIVGRL